ncbi:MAG: chalcone isomerase family protein [Gammaproteobacteria bacterium]|nr:MAG: chalcone isomerase family protein [Gammaproteobacteria bacterium]
MKTLFQSLFYLSLLATPLLAQGGTKIAGVELADSYPLDGKSLALNGAGVRSKFFFKIYVGALYTGKTSNNAAELVAAPGPKSMQMTMLYKEVEAKKITSGWREGFKTNLTNTGFKQLENRLQEFNALFPTLHAGDIVHMDYSQETGTELSINGKLLGTIPGEDFFSALLKVWIGDHPADNTLKAGLLGQ